MGMIERIARVCAIWADHYDPGAWRAYQGVARLILAEMLHPSNEMWAAASATEARAKENLKHFEVTGFCGLAYLAMLAAALAEPDQAKPE